VTNAPLLLRQGVARDGRAFSVRPTRADDAAALVILRDGVAAEGLWVAAVPGERSALEESLALASLLTAGGLALTLEVEGAVAGQLSVARRRGPYEGHVGDLSMALGRDHRGQGLGRVMLQTAVQWSRAVGLAKLCLAVFAGNARARALYGDVGFEEEGLQRSQVQVGDRREDLVLMGLLL